MSDFDFGIVSATNAASSFARGYAQTELLLRRQDRLEEQWQKDMAFKEAQADRAQETINRQFAFEVMKYKEGADLRNLQMDTATVANEVAHINLTKLRLQRDQTTAALGETSALFSQIDFDDPVKAYKDYMTGITSILKKYPYVEQSDLTSLFEMFGKSILSAKTKSSGVHKVVEDVDSSGHTILKTVGKDGTVISHIPLKKFAPGVEQIFKDADTWIKEERDAVLAESREGRGVVGMLDKGLLMLGNAVESQDDAKKMDAYHTILATLEARVQERMGKVRKRLDDALKLYISDDKQREALVETKMGAVDPQIEMPLHSSEEYEKIFEQTYLEDKKDRPGLTPEAWIGVIKQNVLSLPGQHKLNAMEGLDLLAKKYANLPIEVEASPFAEVEKSVEFGPEGSYVQTRTKGKTYNFSKAKAKDIASRPLSLGGRTGNVNVPPILHKKVKDFGGYGVGGEW